MKKVVIVGGGVSGLSAGIHLLKNGFNCIVFEKNHTAGGNLTGWDKNGFHIDNCVHWLTGTDKKSKYYDLWKELGAFDDGDNFYQSRDFYISESDGKTVSLSFDSLKSRKKMLSVSPDDEKEINRFFDAVENNKDIYMNGATPGKRARQLLDYAYFGRMSLNDYSKKFKSRVIGNAITDYIGGEFSALGLILAYSTYIEGNGALLYGGSCHLANSIINKYTQLGGKIYTNEEVIRTFEKNNRIIGVKTKKGRECVCDYVIFACDPHCIFSKLLKRESMPKKLKQMYHNREVFPIYSAYHVALSVDEEKLPFKGTYAFDTPFFFSDNRCIKRITLKEYSHEPSYSPKGKSLIQCMIFQHEKSCHEWIDLRKENLQKYNERKQELNDRIINIIESKFSYLKGKVSVIDSWTPATYNRFLGSYSGSFMSFTLTGKRIPPKVSNIPTGYKNAVLCGQWLSPPGGLPIAALTGKRASETVMKMRNRDSEKIAAL